MSLNAFLHMSGALGVDLDAIIDEVLDPTDKTLKANEWYKSLNMNQKINLKELTDDICGMPFTFMVKIFGFKEAIFHIHAKLDAEGFDV